MTAPEITSSASSLSDLKNRSENSAGRGQILTILQVNSHSIDQKSGEIWTGQADLQPISFKSDRLLVIVGNPFFFFDSTRRFFQFDIDVAVGSI